MKKILPLILFGMTSSVAHAYLENYACLHLIIKIKNNTPHICHLIRDEFNIKSIPQDLPFKILPGETSLLDLKQTYLSTDMTAALQYECGTDHYITLYARKTPCSSQNITDAYVYVSNVQYLKADYKTQAANYWSNVPAVVDWIISAP